MMQSRYIRVRTVLRVRVAGMLFAMTIGLWGATAALAESPGTFTNTGAMATARSEHTATLLLSGEVLVTGDYDSGGNLASAELYDPATGRFRATGAMVTARINHTAALLPSGKVLVAGGWSNGNVLASAEVYDPAAGHFSITGAMTTARSGHTAILLRTARRPGWKVLVVGGWNNDNVLASAEVYDSATGRFSATGTMATARTGHTATLLPNGKVLVVGGWHFSAYTASAEVYDPATGRFSATGTMATARAGHTATLLPSGQVLIAGGWNYSGNLASAEVYDPATGRFSATGAMATVRAGHTATPLPSGQVLVAGGGESGEGGSDATAAAELYDPATGRFGATGTMTMARSEHTATLLLSGQVLVTGGASTDGADIHASAELYTQPDSLHALAERRGLGVFAGL